MTEPAVKRAKFFDRKERRSNLADIPELALKRLLVFLPVRDINTLRLVCKRLLKLITNLKFRYRNKWTIDLKHGNYPDKFDFFRSSPMDICVILPNKNNIDMARVAQFLENYHERVIGLRGQGKVFRHLNPKTLKKISCLTNLQVNSFSVPSNIFNLINVNSSTLEQLEFSNTYLEPLIKLECEMERMEKLKLVNCRLDAGVGNFIGNSMPGIKVIEFHGIDLSSETVLSVPNLQQIKMTETEVGTSALDSLLASSSTNLQELQLAKLNLEEQEMSDWTMKKLKKIELCSCKGDDYLRVLIAQSSQCLKELDMEDLDLSFLLYFNCDMINIKKIRVVRCSEDYTVINLLRGSSSNLQELELYNLGFLKGGINFAFRRLKRLLLQSCVPDSLSLSQLLIQSSECLTELSLFAMSLSELNGPEFEMKTLRRIVISDCAIHSGLGLLLRASLHSLAELYLNHVNLSRFKNLDFNLKILRKVVLRHCKGGQGIRSLLVSCAASLQELFLSNLKMIYLTDLSVEMPKLFKIEIYDCTGGPECISFLKTYSSNIEYLRLHLDYSDFEPVDILNQDLRLDAARQIKMFPFPTDTDIDVMKAHVPASAHFEPSFNDGLLLV